MNLHHHELDRTSWSAYFDAVSEDVRNLPVVIEIFGGGERRLVEASRVALQGLTYDARGDVFEATVARGGPRRMVLRRLIAHPQRIMIDSAPHMPPTLVSIEDLDGVRTVIRITRPPDFSG